MQILDQYGKPFVSAPKQSSISARFDNAQTTDQSARSFWGSDYLSAKAANSYYVRRVLRMRSRYEVSNNPYLWGVCTGNATDLIDSGPTLQCQFKNKAWNVQIEAAWNEWAAEVGLVEKLKTCKLARTVDGEGVLILRTAKDLENPVKLYPADIESDQVTTMAPLTMMEAWIDGVDLYQDGTGRVKSYSVLKYHPGDYYYGQDMNPLATEKIPDKHIVFWFPKFRPGQVRGVPIFTPSLDLFTELRAFRKSVLDAAQTAANHSAVVESEYPPGMDDDDADEQNYQFRRVNINRNMMTVLPHGMKMSQFAATQPGTSYEMFQEKCLGEAIRPLAYPLNLALGTSQKFNFSSAKLDHTNYRKELRVERETEVNNLVLAKIFRAWVDEASKIRGILPDGIQSAHQIPHAWHWPGFESLDPLSDAQADQLRLAGGQDTWQDFWARRGKDWLDVFSQLSEAQRKLFELDIEIGEPTKRTETETDAPAKDPKAEAKRRMERAQRRAEASRREYEALADNPRNRIKAFDESKHPRADDGKFGEGHGNGDAKKSGSNTAEKPSHEHDMKGLEDKLPDEASNPGTWKKIKSFISTASKAVYTGAAALGHKLHDLAPDVLDVAADYAKIFYAGKGSGRGDTPDPFTESVGVGANTIAVVASHLLGRASVWLKKKIGVSFAAGENGEPIDISAIVDILETMFREMHEDLGIEDMEIDREQLTEMIEERVGADA